MNPCICVYCSIYDGGADRIYTPKIRRIQRVIGVFELLRRKFDEYNGPDVDSPDL